MGLKISPIFVITNRLRTKQYEPFNTNKQNKMKIQYQIMELDSSHLKEEDNLFHGKRERVCFLPAILDNFENNIQNSFEEAIKVVERSGKDYTEYTIIPRIYNTEWEK